MYNLLNELKNKEFSCKIDTLLNKENVINSFFDNVKINVENNKILNNRMALLNNLLDTVGDVLDI